MTKCFEWKYVDTHTAAHPHGKKPRNSYKSTSSILDVLL